MAQEKLEIPIAGKVISITAGPGSKVAEGDTVLVLESMKMENPIVAPVSGVVKEIRVKPGDTVEAGQVAAVIEF